jgi:hypothetical protein
MTGKWIFQDSLLDNVRELVLCSALVTATSISSKR